MGGRGRAGGSVNSYIGAGSMLCGWGGGGVGGRGGKVWWSGVYTHSYCSGHMLIRVTGLQEKHTGRSGVGGTGMMRGREDKRTESLGSKVTQGEVRSTHIRNSGESELQNGSRYDEPSEKKRQEKRHGSHTRKDVSKHCYKLHIYKVLYASGCAVVGK